ncbi:replication protein A 70 kDa DNA-binding subunit C-like isoform X2 [Pyrus communis]|uniref:replication protein A 70 kDa DNA-binding subunit C-like isoform X2 n=1 Tax=Pyrus communis TaxID=23211 RepID=UPI0035C1F87F
MENTQPTPIHQLKPYTKANKIKIRICRIWKSTIPGTVQKYTTLNCILVDEMQDAVEATTLNVDYDVMVAKIEAGGCYVIIDFRTSKIRGQYKVVPHETQVLFNTVTKFKKLASVFPPIPRHRFFLQDYNTLYPRLDRVDILTDVIGCIRAVQSLEEKQINQRVAYKCDVHIQNIRKEELTVTLWADIGEAFSSLSTEAFSLPVVVVFTSLKVRRYLGKIVLNSTGSSLFFIDPDIPEVNSYKFSNCKEFPKILPPSSDQANEAKLLQIAKKVTIDELAFLDPDLYKDETFLCKAAVKHFDTRYDWWYSACPICVKQMHKDPTSAQLICQKHPNQIPTPCLESINFSLHQWYKVNLILEDETNEIDALIIGKCGEKLFGMSCKDLVLNQTLVDHQQLPNEFLRLIGQKKNFHLRFGNRRNNFNPSNVLIQNVTDDTTMQPATPLPLPREITGSSTTVSSSTSSAETTEQSNKRKRESIKRTLFTNNEQREKEEVSEADPREFDEVPIKLLKKKSSPTSGKLGTPPEKTN